MLWLYFRLAMPSKPSSQLILLTDSPQSKLQGFWIHTQNHSIYSIHRLFKDARNRMQGKGYRVVPTERMGSSAEAYQACNLEQERSTYLQHKVESLRQVGAEIQKAIMCTSIQGAKNSSQMEMVDSAHSSVQLSSRALSKPQATEAGARAWTTGRRGTDCPPWACCSCCCWSSDVM